MSANYFLCFYTEKNSIEINKKSNICVKLNFYLNLLRNWKENFVAQKQENIFGF